jgi:hypothetical protein
MNNGSDSFSAAQRDLFLPLAACYFALPVLIFLFGWLRPAIGIPAGIVVAGGCIWFALRYNSPVRPALTQKNLLLILTVAFVWTLLVGVGGVLPQSSDYLKHNLLLHDLTSANWPVTYSQTSGETFLCYSLGYYLVPALGGRLVGTDIIPAIQFVWTFTGLFLFFLVGGYFDAVAQENHRGHSAVCADRNPLDPFQSARTAGHRHRC